MRSNNSLISNCSFYQEQLDSLSNSNSYSISSFSIINDDFQKDLEKKYLSSSDSENELINVETEALNQDQDCVIICENDFQIKNKKSKKLNKYLEIIEKLIKTNKQMKSPRQQISLGMRCLALKDRNRFKWKLARITRITDSNLLNHQANQNNSSQIYKMICNCKYTVKFDSEEEEETESNYYVDDNINKDLREDDRLEQELDLELLIKNSSEDDDDEIIECISQNNNLKKRKLKSKTNEKQLSSDPRFVKKRKNRNNIGLVELDAKSIAFLDNYEFIPNIYSNKIQNRALFEPKSRVVTLYQMKIETYDKSRVLIDNEYMSSGTVLEVPSIANFRRYLVLFDNGVALYVKPDHLFPIFDMFGQPLEILNLDHLMFLQNYCRIYPERKLVRLNQNDIVQVFFNNKWCTSKVMDVEGSLVSLLIKSSIFNKSKLSQPLMYYIKLHRGSFCLFPMYEKFISSLDNSIKNSIELSPYEDYIKDKRNDTVQNLSTKKYISGFASSIFPNIGLKEKDSKLKNYENTNHKSIDKIIQGQLKHLNMENVMRDEIIPFKPHPCTNACVAKWENRFTEVKAVNPLLIPVLHGWQRHIGNISKNLTTMTKKFIRYVTPCGRMLRSTAEIDHYLFLTNSKLTIDMFTTDNYIHTDREFEANAKNLKITDISHGQENVPISVVNCVDKTRPDDFIYSANRIPLDGVPLITDSSLMEGCNCIDNCRDRTKCSCWRKSFEATLFNSDQMNTNIGYRGRRLLDLVHTGIFECNSNCQCDYRCSNRLVQNGISVRLQLFKTNNKGWGLRCLDDIPKGTFICNYSGHLITEEISDIRGRELGDEYFAELDFVEYLKRSQNTVFKQEEKILYKNYDNSQINILKKISTKSKDYQRPKQQNKKKRNPYLEETHYILLDSDEDEQDRSNPNLIQISNKEDEYNKNKVLNRQQKEKNMVSSINSNRFFTNQNNKFFFENFINDSSVFIMDAKILGNIGRYFNHSCSPNIFVQNVFVDTYDLRFPWIAFFANTAIKAGAELCWDYNYTIGSVQDRVLYCHCNSSNCRGRLL